MHPTHAYDNEKKNTRSLNGFLASTEGSDMAPEGTGYLGLEPYDIYWGRVRDMYAPFENGMKSGTARVFDHQIPGKKREEPLLVCVRASVLCVFRCSGCGGRACVRAFFSCAACICLNKATRVC